VVVAVSCALTAGATRLSHIRRVTDAWRLCRASRR